jgi:putative PIN family toxin of toxin-antitoxin system
VRLAVLDTNVIVYAGIRKDGASAKLIIDWVLEGQVIAVLSSGIVAEYREVMQREKFSRYDFPPLWLEFLIEEGLRLEEPDPWPHMLPDAKDAPFLALAHAAGAVLVTGNLKHFSAAARKGVTVLSPAEYLVQLTGGPSHP